MKEAICRVCDEIFEVDLAKMNWTAKGTGADKDGKYRWTEGDTTCPWCKNLVYVSESKNE